MFIHGDTIFHTLYGNMVVLKLLSRKLLKQLFIVPVQAKKNIKMPYQRNEYRICLA